MSKNKEYQKSSNVNPRDISYISIKGQNSNIERQHDKGIKSIYKGLKGDQYIPKSGQPKNIVRRDQVDSEYFTLWNYKQSAFYQFSDKSKLLYIGAANYGKNVRKFIPDINKKFWINPERVEINSSNIMKLNSSDILNFTFPIFKKSYIPIAWFGRIERGPIGGKKFRYNAPWSTPLAADIAQSQIMQKIREGLSMAVGAVTKVKGRRASRLFDYKIEAHVDGKGNQFNYAVPMLPISASSGKYFGMLPAPVRMMQGVIRAAFSKYFLEEQHKRVQNNISISKQKWKQFATRNENVLSYVHLANYKQKPKEETINLIINTSSVLRSKVKLWEDENQTMFDSLSYQAESYKHLIWSREKDNDDWTAKIQNNTYKYGKQQAAKGSIIKFQIQDVNNKRLLTTPAFLQSVEDKGLQGQWQDVDYIGGHYPKFQYKGMDKRSISFVFMLGCFESQYLPQYIQKLNFLRGVGAPSFKQIEIGEESEKRKLQMMQAPIYKLTLGDIVFDTYGYFESCELSWQQSFVWNLDRVKLLKMLNNNTTIKKDINDIQIPIYTKVSATFVCMYGSSPKNTDQFYKVNGV